MLLDLKPGVDRNDSSCEVAPGVTVTGQVVGPDDRPVRDAWIFSQIIMRPAPEDRKSGTAATTTTVPATDTSKFTAWPPMPRSPSTSLNPGVSWVRRPCSRAKERRLDR